MAENVHQQRVGTGACIEFHPASAFRAGQRPPALSVNLRQALAPCGICPDRHVASRLEVAMSSALFIGHKADGWRFAVAQTMRQSLSAGVLLSEFSQVATKRGGKIHGIVICIIANKKRMTNMAVINRRTGSMRTSRCPRGDATWLRLAGSQSLNR